MRSGVIAQKMGMTRIFTEAGEHIPVTVLKLENVSAGHDRREPGDVCQRVVDLLRRRLRGAIGRLGAEPAATLDGGDQRLKRPVRILEEVQRVTNLRAGERQLEVEHAEAEHLVAPLDQFLQTGQEVIEVEHRPGN